MVSGQALGGVFTAIIEIMTITFASDPRSSALIFFSIGNALLVLSLIAYVVMARASFFRYYTSEKKIQKRTLTQLQRQPSIREPIFKEVLNKMWMYGFTEWLVCMLKPSRGAWDIYIIWPLPFDVEFSYLFQVFVVTLSVYPSVTG